MPLLPGTSDQIIQNLSFMSWLNFLTAAGVGGLIVAVINNFTSLKVAKDGRDFSFKKEEFTILQEKMIEVFGYIYDNEEKLRHMRMQMSIGMTDLNFLQKDKDGIEKIKRSIFTIIHIYSPQLREAFDEYSTPVGKAMKAYFKAIKEKVLTEEMIDSFNSSAEELAIKRQVFAEKIILLLDEKRNLIN